MAAPLALTTRRINLEPSALARSVFDRTAWAASGWDDPDPAEVPEDDILSRLLALNLERTFA